MAIWVTTGQIGFQAPITDNSFTTNKGASPTTPTGYTRNVNLINTGTYTNECNIHVAHMLPSGAGATGAVDWGTSTTNASICASIAFPPSAAAPARRNRMTTLGVG